MAEEATGAYGPDPGIVPPKSAVAGPLVMVNGSGTTPLFGSLYAAPSETAVMTKLPLWATVDWRLIVCPQVVVGAVVVMQSDTSNDAPGTNDAGVAPPQVAPAEKTAVTAAWDSIAKPSDATNKTITVRKILVRFMFCLFTS